MIALFVSGIIAFFFFTLKVLIKLGLIWTVLGFLIGIYVDPAHSKIWLCVGVALTILTWIIRIVKLIKDRG